MAKDSWDRYFDNGKRGRKTSSVWSSDSDWDRYFSDAAFSFGRGVLRLGQSLSIGKSLAGFLRWGSKFKL